MKKSHGKIAKLGLALTLAFGLFTQSAFAAAPVSAVQPAKTAYAIVNPYENVDWASYGQYKAAHHTHSTYSDGSNFRRDTLIDNYNKGFDIVAMTDHDVTTSAWDALPNPGTGNWNNIGTGVLTAAELAAIKAGTYDGSNFQGQYTGIRQQANGMIGMGASNEITAGNGFGDGSFGGHHINAFFTTDLPGNVGSGKTMAQVLAAVEAAGGITHINHPGRYTGGQNNASQSSNPANVNRYVELFMAYKSCVGIEIINKWDGESINDRILWDNILTQTASQGRLVWGFSNDDSHSLSANGHAWNVMLMPTFDEAAVRTSMETGAFYGVSRIDRQHGINNDTPGAPAQTTTTSAMYSGGNDNARALALLEQATPSISNIAVSGSVITITGADYQQIVWYSGTENNASKMIATGNSIDISLYADAIANGYVRAELVGEYGVAYTQPFGVVETTCENVNVDASVKQLNGNKNDLTVTVTETFVGFFGGQEIVSIVETVKTFSINNNAAGTYEVGGYKVYVDTKGNTQIRECYIVK